MLFVDFSGLKEGVVIEGTYIDFDYDVYGLETYIFLKDGA